MQRHFIPIHFVLTDSNGLKGLPQGRLGGAVRWMANELNLRAVVSRIP